jgi:multicomponent Na+:H+ antiporter subunit E
MRIAARIVLLVALWILMWGELSIANVVTGVAVAGALLVVFPPEPPVGHLRVGPMGVLRLTGYVIVQLVRSNVVMTREILRRRPQLHPGVVAHRLATPSQQVVTLMTNVIALSPGTMVVDVDVESTTIAVHFLKFDDPERSRAALAHLEQLVVAAIAAPLARSRGARP